jgi:hypothetical protein
MAARPVSVYETPRVNAGSVVRSLTEVAWVLARVARGWGPYTPRGVADIA